MTAAIVFWILVGGIHPNSHPRRILDYDTRAACERDLRALKANHPQAELKCFDSEEWSRQ
jgi:hypothetical protein